MKINAIAMLYNPGGDDELEFQQFLREQNISPVKINSDFILTQFNSSYGSQ